MLMAHQVVGAFFNMGRPAVDLPHGLQVNLPSSSSLGVVRKEKEGDDVASNLMCIVSDRNPQLGAFFSGGLGLGDTNGIKKPVSRPSLIHLRTIWGACTGH